MRANLYGWIKLPCVLNIAEAPERPPGEDLAFHLSSGCLVPGFLFLRVRVLTLAMEHRLAGGRPERVHGRGTVWRSGW